MEPRAIVLFRRMLVERRLGEETMLSQGLAKDYASYQNAVGCIRGLDTAMAMLDEAIKQAAEGK